MANKRKMRDMTKLLRKYRKRELTAKNGEEYATHPSELFTRDIPQAVADLPGRVKTAVTAPFKASTYIPAAKPVAAPPPQPAVEVADTKKDLPITPVKTAEDNQKASANRMDELERQFGLSTGTAKVKRKKGTEHMGLRGC